MKKMEEKSTEGKNVDRIDEAYKGDLGEEMRKASRERIHWITTQAKGEYILDIGCSQGTAAVILARKGKKVQGLDICQESIDYALASLEQEDSATKENVDFVCADFIFFAENLEKRYDCILLCEVLEHLTDPLLFLKRSKEILVADGRLIVTVPFGISPHPDHRRSYYLIELFKSIEDLFFVKEVKFFGSWLGIVGTMQEVEKVVMDEALFRQAEKAFHQHEMALQNGLVLWQTRAKDANEKYGVMTKKYEMKIQEIEKQHEKKMAGAIEENKLLLEKLTISTKEIGRAIDLLKKNEIEINRLRGQLNILQKENSQYQWKINKITGTWYGKIMIKVYHFLRKIKRKLRG